MTISSTTRKAGPFDGNGVTTSFPFTFKVFNTGDIAVVRTMPSGLEETLVLDSDYSVTLNGDQDANPGGTITYPISGDPLPADWRLTAVGDLDNLQPTDITNGGGFYPQVIENALDRVTMLLQQLDEEIDRTIRIAVSDDTTTGLELPAAAARADRVLGFDANGNFRVYDTNISARATGIEVFTATGGQTVFTTTFTYVPNANALLVFQNGAVLTPGVDFTETSGTEFTLTVGATIGDTVVALAGLDVTGGVQGDQIVDGSIATAKLADGSVTAPKLAGALDLTGKTITVATAAGSDSDTSVASTAMVQAAISARTATESAAGILEIATQAETDAGADDARIVTPKKLRWGFGASLGSIDGYIKLPSWLGGVTIQWGRSAAVGNGATTNVTFPIAFSTACLRVVCSPESSGANTLNYSVSAISYSTTGFVGTNNSGTSGTTQISYIAIGY